MRLLIYGMQSSGASTLAMLLAQKPGCAAFVDIWTMYAAPSLPRRQEPDVVAKVVVTMTYPLEMHQQRFRPDHTILFLRHPQSTYRSLASKIYRNHCGFIDEKFGVLEKVFRNRSAYDSLLYYEDLILDPHGTARAFESLGWGWDPNFLKFRRTQQHIEEFNNAHFPGVAQRLQYGTGNHHFGKGLRASLVDLTGVGECSATVRALCPELVEHYESLTLQRAAWHLPAGIPPVDAPSMRVTEYSPDPRLLPPHGAPARSICIVTNEFTGLYKNGGIGTANTGLALALAEAGLKVTVLYCNPQEISDVELASLRRSYGRKGVALEIIGETPALRRPFDSPSSISYAVFLFLKERRFDVVYFHDNCGRGYYSLLAKHTGCYPNPPLLLVVAHGPTEWVYELNSSAYFGKEAVLYTFLERRSVELADALISPSRYLLEWLIARGWKLPTKIFVEHNVVPMPQLAARRNGGAASHKIREIVFFGRMEPRKGLLLFFDAIDLLSERVDLAETKITFLGKFDRIDSVHSGAFVVERSRRWSAAVRFLVTKSQQEALEYLMVDGVLAVIPSLAENSPCVVLECLQLGIPFVATDTGGTPELVERDAWQRCLCPPDARVFADRLESALFSGHAAAALAVTQRTTIERWLRFHECSPMNVSGDRHTVTRDPVPVVVGDAPLVSICVVATAQELEASYAFDSIATQDYPHVEILIADRSIREAGPVNGRDAGKDSDRTIPMRRLHRPGLSLAACRNEIAGEATGRYLLFIDIPEVIMLPGSLALLVQAAEKTGARLVSAFGLRLPADIRAVPGRDGEIARFPIGPSLEIGAVENCFVEHLVLAERRSFEQWGGFPLGEDAVVGFWQLWVAALSAGIHTELLPQALYWYRQRRPMTLSRSLAVASTRATLNLLAGMPLSSVRHLLETYVDVSSEQQHRLNGHVANLSPYARELVNRLSWHEPNSPRALEIFVDYLLETGRSREALDFVFHNKLESSHLRRFNREMAFEFEWHSQESWQVEVHLAQEMTPEHAGQVTAHLGETAVPIRVQGAEPGCGPRLLITGPVGNRTAPALKLRIGIPAICRVDDASYQLGYTVTGVMIRKVNVAAVDFEAAKSPQDRDPAAFELRDEVFGLVRLDEFYRGDSYRHLDISVLAVRAAGHHWPHLKFKFCLTGNRSYMEFREAPDWPMIFVTFPGEETDDYGSVFHASATTIAKVLPIQFARDAALFAAISAYLPEFVRQAAQRALLTPAETEEFISASEGLAEDLNRALKGGAGHALSSISVS